MKIMMSETLINDTKTITPNEIFGKTKGKKLIKWNMKKNGKIGLEIEEIPVEFAEELDEIHGEMKSGKKYKLDVDSLEEEFVSNIDSDINGKCNN